jgi:DNA-directed RNA polymerase specialized sigma24 family protein
MATSKALNESFKNFSKSRDIAPLLAIVREHVIKKMFREEEKDDIAQECLLNVWRSVDPTCPRPLARFDISKSSFSSWLAKRIQAVARDYKKVYGTKELCVEPFALERMAFDTTDPWNSEGRRWTIPKPLGDFYHEEK